MISRVQSYQKLQKTFPAKFTDLECDTLKSSHVTCIKNLLDSCGMWDCAYRILHVAEACLPLTVVIGRALVLVSAR